MESALELWLAKLTTFARTHRRMAPTATPGQQIIATETLGCNLKIGDESLLTAWRAYKP